MLQLDDLSKHFAGAKCAAVEGVNLHLQRKRPLSTALMRPA